MEHSRNVVTYQTSSNAKLTLCSICRDAMGGTYPADTDHRGERFSSVYYGEHYGICDRNRWQTVRLPHVTDADIVRAQGGHSHFAGDPITVRCPADYDPDKITAEDVVHDAAITRIETETESHREWPNWTNAEYDSARKGLRWR